MRLNKTKILVSVFPIVIFFALTFCSKNETENKPSAQKINLYLVALEGSSLNGKMIGCNDLLVAVEKEITPEKSALETALLELMNYQSNGELENFVKGPGLVLVQVTIARGLADVYFRGAFNISGTCDIPRIQEQLYETARQFTEYKKIRFFINDETLENYLSVASKGF